MAKGATVIRTIRLAGLAALAPMLVAAAYAQSMTGIVASTANAGTRGPINGTACLFAVDGTKQKISVTIAGGGFYEAGQPFCQTLTAGAFAGSLSVPNPLTDSAPGHGYDITIWDNTTGKTIDIGVTYAIGGASWSLDNWVPSITAPTAAAFTFTVGSGSAPTSCTAPALDVRVNSGTAVMSVCFGGVFIAATSGGGGGGGGSESVITGVRYGNGAGADTVASSAQMQSAIGASIYDISGAAATAQAASLQKSSNLSDLASAATARTNLGLGTAATTAASAYDAAGAAATATDSVVQEADTADGLQVGGSTAATSYMNGKQDEARVSNVARSSSWITADHNNQSSPSTFYSVGSPF